MTTPVTQQSFDDFAVRMEATMGRFEAGLTNVRSDIANLRVDHLELRAGMAELRATVAELGLRGLEYEQAAKSRFETLTDSIADLRNEYRGHTHD